MNTFTQCLQANINCPNLEKAYGQFSCIKGLLYEKCIVLQPTTDRNSICNQLAPRRQLFLAIIWMSTTKEVNLSTQSVRSALTQV